MSKIAVFGLGKLGSPMLAVFAAAGHEVLGVDLNTVFVDAINNRTAPVDETGLQKELSAAARYRATTDGVMAATWADIMFIVVPTPSLDDGTFTSRYVQSVCIGIGKGLAVSDRYQVVVVTSTVMPGAMANEIVPVLEAASGKKVNVDFGVCYNPEFIAIGSVIKNMRNPDMILIGESDARAGTVLENFYKQNFNNCFVPIIQRMNFINAELTKIAVNTFVTMKISYANMLGDICDRLPGADACVVAAAVGDDTRVGQRYIQPATAFGGPCFPRDNRAMAMIAANCGTSAPLAEATAAINNTWAAKLATRIVALAPKRVAILGLAYKPDTALTEESAGLLLRDALSPHVDVVVGDPNIPARSDLHACIAGADVVVIANANPVFKELQISQPCTVFDCWRILSPENMGYNVRLIYPGRCIQ